MNYKRLSDVLRSVANLIEDFGSALDFDDIETDILKEDLKVLLDMADDIEEKNVGCCSEMWSGCYCTRE